MVNQDSVVTQLLALLPDWPVQMYFKSSLTALSHAMEDQVLANTDRPLVIACFQRERFYRQEAHRYRRIAAKSDHVYVLSSPETEFVNASGVYETIAFTPEDALAKEWHLIVLGERFASCLLCRERILGETETGVDPSRRFEGLWTCDRQVTQLAAGVLLDRIAAYRPELETKVDQAKRQFLPPTPSPFVVPAPSSSPDPFIQRLVTYLQAGQYKLLKANRSLAQKEQKERLINSITTAIRQSLDTEEILQLAIDNLGEGLGVCRCVIYRCQDEDETAIIHHEFLNPGIASIKGKPWPLRDNPFFQEVKRRGEALRVVDAQKNPQLPKTKNPLHRLVKSCAIASWLLVPILHQGRLLGMVELHHCGPEPTVWKEEDVLLVNAIATQVGVALIQAEAYSHLEQLNDQLAALDRTRSNLVAITGHELRTPLSTIQVCLESLASEPDMPLELQQVMLSTALQDAERMRKLIQDFLTLSQLESGRVQWNLEPIILAECVELAISNVRARQSDHPLPPMVNEVSFDLPVVQADGEWLVEVLAKLLDNACKFTEPSGQIAIRTVDRGGERLQVVVADTGRGIEPNRLETVFDRFYQEEGALRRSAGGTGLGLAICRQIVAGWGGQIWAESAGKDQGSMFHFTLPLLEVPVKTNGRRSRKKAISSEP